MSPESPSGADTAPGDAHAPTLPKSVDPPARAALGPGSVLAERYRLGRRIGGGGMGSVWEGEHLALGTTVAIKLINPALVDDERARARFLREAQAAATLRGPHVVQIFDHGVHEGTPYIAMELLDGEPLSARIARCGRLAPAEVLAIMTQVGHAIAKAHEAGVVHRDLKPDNIHMVGEHGDIAKVLDFGIAKRSAESALATTTSSGTLLGTPFYMSPEQLVDAGLADARADLWSLAVITYECLVGERPFVAASMPELAVALLAEPSPVPSHHGDVPAAFDAWFERATARDPEARFQDVAQMLAALGDALTIAASPSPPALAPKEARTSAVLVFALALGGAAAIAAFALTRTSTPPAGEPADEPVAPAAVESPPAPRVDAHADAPPTPGVPAAVAPPADPPADVAASSRPTEPKRKPTGKPPRKRTDPADATRPPQDPRELEP